MAALPCIEYGLRNRTAAKYWFISVLFSVFTALLGRTPGKVTVPVSGGVKVKPALASWHGATICEVAIRNVNREHGVSHYGITRTFRVFFDLLTIRFLLRYLSRPLHFFGSFGMMSIFGGSGIVLWLGLEKFLRHVPVMA